jgi:multiple sugar transport system permease protein
VSTGSVAAETGPADAQTGKAAKPKKQLSERAREERRLGWLLCAPAVIVMLAVTAYPIGYAIWLSLQKSDLRFPDNSEFVGLSNYVSVLSSDIWWEYLWNTVKITAVSVAIELVLGMLIALVMHRVLTGRGLIRASVLVPYGIITVVAALAWKYAFDPTTGFINSWFGLDTAWLTQDGTSFWVIIATEVWKTTPFMALLLLAGLALVPDELHEAAKVDGASAWNRFWRITVPLMKPAIVVALLFRTLDAFRVFDSVFILTEGANNPTVSILGYEQLVVRLNLGMGSAVSVLIFICVLIIAFAFVKGLGASMNQQAGNR